MTGRALMLQGTGSDVGKSVLTAGLCRAFLRRGFAVRPFKPQNMSNNAAVADDAEGGSGEIGRAQWLQALACGVAPSVHMNPVLLKPNSDTGSQVVLRGRAVETAEACAYWSTRGSLLAPVIESFERLKAEADLVVVEGAGSAAEANLRQGDIANMGFAVPTGTPVVLVGDINRGGVIAALIGTQAVLDGADRDRVAGFIVNLFRGDPRLFDDGLAMITERTGWRSFGVVPFLPEIRALPAEDAVVLEQRRAGADDRIVVAVPMIARIANFDDLDPLRADPAFDVRFCPPGTALPGDASLVVLPGTKSTLSDLRFLKAQGWDIDIRAHVRRGGRVLGLCGGYQMLGRRVRDPEGIEGPAGEEEGLGLLDVETVIAPAKTVRNAVCRSALLDAEAHGYEIHAGRTTGPGLNRTFLERGDEVIGVVSGDGLVVGSYLHGMLGDDTFRDRYLRFAGLSGTPGMVFAEQVETALDALADALERHLDVDALLDAAR
ncbi:MAG: cobyric acid synthase [Thalassobaculaceae bacterium]|nr:cobyric acid synthase [Thalassobaculaceae bacterium]